MPTRSTSKLAAPQGCCLRVSIEFISLDEIVGAENADEMYEKYVLEKKNKLRIRYAKEVSFGTDVSLFFKTVTAVFKKAMRVVGKSNREK